MAGRLPEPTRARLFALIATAEDGGGDHGEDGHGSALWASIRSEPGNVSLNTVLVEIVKLEAVRAVGLPAGLFAGVAPKILAGWRARAAVEAPSHLREHPPLITLTLLAALLRCREREITDTHIFLARYLRGRDLQREINEGLNVVESWNRANSVIFYGKIIRPHGDPHLDTRRPTGDRQPRLIGSSATSPG